MHVHSHHDRDLGVAPVVHLPVLPEPSVRVSNSQIGRWMDCNRWWGFEKIDRIRPPPKPSAQLGNETHTSYERWFKYGEPPDRKTKAGELAIAGMTTLPVLGPDLLIEEWFEFRCEDIAYVGKADLISFREEVPRVIDHKTTGSFDWALTDEELPFDIQTIVYGTYVVARYGVDSVRLQWNYIRTRGKPVVQPATNEVTRAFLDSAFAEVHKIAKEIRDIGRKAKTAMDLKPNYRSCWKFGGCPFESICQPTALQLVIAIMLQEERKVKLAQKLRQHNAGSNAPGSPSPQPLVSPNGQSAPPVHSPQPPPPNPEWDPQQQQWVYPAQAAQAPPPPPPPQGGFQPFGGMQAPPPQAAPSQAALPPQAASPAPALGPQRTEAQPVGPQPVWDGTQWVLPQAAPPQAAPPQAAPPQAAPPQAAPPQAAPPQAAPPQGQLPNLPTPGPGPDITHPSVNPPPHEQQEIQQGEQAKAQRAAEEAESKAKAKSKGRPATKYAQALRAIGQDPEALRVALLIASVMGRGPEIVDQVLFGKEG